MEDTVAAPRASLARGGSLVAPALTFVNVVAYVLTIAAARVLGKDEYGALVALLGVLLVACVPAIGLQAVVARTVVAHGADPRALLRRSGAVGVGLALAGAALAPAVAAFLHTGLLGPLLVASQLLPFALLSGAMGVLQGSERFGALAVVICAQGVARACGVVPLLWSGSSEAVLAALSLGIAAAAVLAVLLVGRSTGTGSGRPPGPRAVAAATGGLLALLALTNLDVLLARNVLSGTESGRYSVGSVLAKAAFWLPQAVAVVVFPRLGDADAGRALLRRAVALVGALGLVELLGCLLLAGPVLRVTFGDTYGSLAPVAWLWVVQGACLSVVQLLVYRAIAVRDRVTGWVIAGAAAAEAAVVLAWQPARPGPVVAVAAGVAVVTTAGLLVRSAR